MRVIVAHPEQQHSFRLATALKSAGMLEKYFTTVYFKRWNLTDIVAHILPTKYKKKAESRHCDFLDDSDIKQFCEGIGLLKLLCNYVPFLKKYYLKIRIRTADKFARKVAKYAIKNRVDAVVTYDNCSPILFEILKEKAPDIVRILDMSAANLLFMKEIYEKDFKLAPSFEDRLKSERFYIWDKKYMNRIKREIETTQYFLVPSNFVKRSLIFSGIEEEQMLYCPYGVDVSSFSLKNCYSKIRQKPIEFIYVGGVKELKGINYLLKSFKQFSSSEAHLTIIGDVNDADDISQYKNIVSFVGWIQHDKICEYYQKSDVFVFPSLGDSFSLSALEAAACGLPLIVSRNTGMSDLITNGKEGFVIEEQSVDSITKSVQWFIDNPCEISRMGISAREMALNSDWDKYYKNVSLAISKCLNN